MKMNIDTVMWLIIKLVIIFVVIGASFWLLRKVLGFGKGASLVGGLVLGLILLWVFFSGLV